MKGRLTPLILTILIFAAISFPMGVAEAEKRAVLMTIIFRLPAFFIVLFLTLGTRELDRRDRGWTTLTWIDCALIPALIAFTLLLGWAFSPVGLPVGFSDVPWPFIVILAIMVAVIEEGYFRSWLLTELPRLGLPPYWALSISCLLFSLTHAWQGLTAVLFAALAGLMYGAIFIWRRNLIVLIVSHAAYNTLAMLSTLSR